MCRTSGQFQSWSINLAGQFGYNVEFSGIGQVERSGHGQQLCAGTGYATQAAVFSRSAREDM